MKLCRYDEDMDEDIFEKVLEMIWGVVDYVRILEEWIIKFEEVDIKDLELKLIIRVKYGYEWSDFGFLFLIVKFFYVGGELSSSGGWVNNMWRKGFY